MGGKVETVLWKIWGIGGPRALIALVPFSIGSTSAASFALHFDVSFRSSFSASERM